MPPPARARTPAKSSKTSGRVELFAGDADGRLAEFAAAVRTGLSASEKHLPARWLFDGEGVALLRQIRTQPEYYQVRAERQLLAARAYALPLYFPAAPTFVEIGAVDAERTEILLRPLLEEFSELRYVAVGPDRAAVEAPCSQLAAALPGLRATAMVGRVVDALREMRGSPRPVLLYWPEAGVTCHDRPTVTGVMAQLADALRGSDLLVAGIDLRKDPRLVQRAYRDRAGRSRRLQLNLLERINNELGGEFDVSNFRDRVVYDEPSGRLDVCLVSRRSQTVRIRDLDLDVRFGKGEAVHTITTTKFSPREIDQLTDAVGLTVHERWYDREGRVCTNLMRLRPTLSQAVGGQALHA